MCVCETPQLVTECVCVLATAGRRLGGGDVWENRGSADCDGASQSLHGAVILDQNHLNRGPPGEFWFRSGLCPRHRGAESAQKYEYRKVGSKNQKDAYLVLKC